MKITNKIHLLKINFSVPVTPEKSLPRFVNVLIIFGDYITLVDSGVDGSHAAIYDYIEKHGRQRSEIKKLIISHAHPDHIGSAQRIKTDTGCEVIGHANEKEWIENIDFQYKSRPVPGFYTLVNVPVKMDTIWTGGEEVSLDNDIHIQIINTPGHSKGSFSILFKEDQILFTADSLPVENDIPTYDNYKALSDSIRYIRSLQGFTTLLSSWTTPLKDQAEIQSLINKGETYLHKLDSIIRECYAETESNPLDNCRKVITAAGLPAIFAIPLVDRAFRTHL